MKYRVLISDHAVGDVIRNSQWWAANHSQGKVIERQSAIFEVMQSLDVMPESKPLAPENSDFPYELRAAMFGLGSRPGYRILFTVVDDCVNVLAVKAAEEDWITPDELL